MKALDLIAPMAIFGAYSLGGLPAWQGSGDGSGPRYGAVEDGDAIGLTASESAQHGGGERAGEPDPGGAPPRSTDSEPEPCTEYSVGVGGYVVGLDGCGGGLPANWIPEDAPEVVPGGPVGPVVDEPVVLSVEEFRRLPIDPGGVQVQPARGWVLVNVETIAFSGAGAQVLQTEVLGRAVRVRVEPVDFWWDFGDGSLPVVSSDAGAPFPEHTVGHVYTEVADERRVTLRTRWAGQFQVDGSGPWQPVAGLATTTQASAAFAVREARTALVAND